MSQNTMLTEEQFNALPENVQEIILNHDQKLTELRFHGIMQPPTDAGEEANVQWIKEEIKLGTELVSMQKELFKEVPQLFTEEPIEYNISSNDQQAAAWIEKAKKELELEAA